MAGQHSSKDFESAIEPRLKTLRSAAPETRSDYFPDLFYFIDLYQKSASAGYIVQKVLPSVGRAFFHFMTQKSTMIDLEKSRLEIYQDRLLASPALLESLKKYCPDFDLNAEMLRELNTLWQKYRRDLIRGYKPLPNVSDQSLEIQNLYALFGVLDLLYCIRNRFSTVDVLFLLSYTNALTEKFSSFDNLLHYFGLYKTNLSDTSIGSEVLLKGLLVAFRDYDQAEAKRIHITPIGQGGLTLNRDPEYKRIPEGGAAESKSELTQEEQAQKDTAELRLIEFALLTQCIDGVERSPKHDRSPENLLAFANAMVFFHSNDESRKSLSQREFVNKLHAALKCYLSEDFKGATRDFNELLNKTRTFEDQELYSDLKLFFISFNELASDAAKRKFIEETRTAMQARTDLKRFIAKMREKHELPEIGKINPMILIGVSPHDDQTDANNVLARKIFFDAPVPDNLRNLSLDAFEPHGRTPLMLAVQQENLRWVEALLKAGANPNLIDKTGKNALHLAAAGSDARILQLLLNSRNLNSASLSMADESGKTPDESGKTPFDYAEQENRYSQGMMLFPARPKKPETRFVQEVRALFIKERRKLPDLNQAINQAFSDDTLDSNTILSLSTYLMLAELVGDDQEKLKRIQSALDTPKKRALYEDAKRIYQTISATLAPNSSQKRTPLSEIPSLETLLNLRHVINTTLDKYKKTEGNSYKLLEFFRDTVSFMIACHTYPDSLLTRPAIELIKNSIDELVDASDKWRSPNHRFASINSLLAQAFREKAGLPDRPLTKADAPALKKALWTGEWEEDLHRTPLMNAASTGNWGAVNQILERAFNDGTLEATLKATDILGNTALHLAQNQSVARVLLSYSSSFELIEQQNLKGKIPTESAGVQAMGLLFPMKEKQLSIEPLTEASSPIETFRFRLNQAINEYEKKHTDHQERHSYKAAIQLLSYLDRMIALRRDTTEGANPPELIELERQGLERKIAHLVMQSGQHHSHVGADSLVTFLANAYGHYLPLNMFGRVLPSKEDMTKGLTLLAQGPQGPDDVVEHTEAVLRALQSSTTDPKEATKNPCSTLSKETVEKLLKHFVQHLWMGGKTKGDYRVLNNLLRNDQLLEASIDTEERQRNLLNFIITAYQDNPSSMGRDQLKKDFYEELGKGNLTQEKALKIAAILERWNLPFPTADKASRAEYHTTNRSQVVDQLLPLRLESENWSHIARRFNHLISIDPAARLGGVAAWFYFSLAQESRYEGETSMIRYRAIVNPIAYINSQAKATCTWTYQELISNPKLHEAVVELDRLWQQHRTQILKTLRPDDDFVAEPYGYQDLPDDSPEMQELNRFHRLEDMIQTLIYENPEHIKKLPRDFRVCAELLRGPKTGNPQIPFHGLNLKRVEAIELAVLLMKQLPDPAPERDAAEEKAEGTAAPRFTEGEIRLAQGIQTLAAHSGSSSAGLTALKERLLILKDPTPRQVIDCFLGTAIERKYMARQDNAPTPDTKMAGASANPEANEEAAVASQDQSTREKLQAKATEFLRNKTLQELYDLIEQIHSDTANQNSLITQFLEKVYSYSEDAKKHRPDDYIPLLNEYRNDRVVKNWHERSTEEGTTRMVQSLDSMPLAVSRGEKLSPYQIWTYINQISWIPPLTDFIAATLINATDVMNEQLRKKGGHAFSKNDLQLDIIRKLYSTPDCPPRSLLCILAQQGNVAALKIILDISVQIQRQEKDDLEMLTTSGGILSQLTNDDDTNIFHHVNDVETFELLLKKIHYQRISKLLDTQATIKTSDGSQTEVLSPLGLAVSKGNVEVVKAMLRAGADPAQVKVPISTDRTSPEWEIAKELIKANLPPSTEASADIEMSEMPSIPAQSATVLAPPTRRPELEDREVASKVKLQQFLAALNAALKDYKERTHSALSKEESPKIAERLLKHLHYLMQPGSSFPSQEERLQLWARVEQLILASKFNDNSFNTLLLKALGLEETPHERKAVAKEFSKYFRIELTQRAAATATEGEDSDDLGEARLPAPAATPSTAEPPTGPGLGDGRNVDYDQAL